MKGHYTIGWLLVLVFLFLIVPLTIEELPLQATRYWAIIATMLLPVMFLLGWLFRHRAGNHNG